MIELAFSNNYIYKLPDGHRFPIDKYQLVKEQLVHEGTATEEQFKDPGLVAEELILKVHTRDYWEKLKTLSLPAKLVRQIGLPINEISVKRARSSVAGTVMASHQALGVGVGFNLSGGTHHAYADHGEGFCVLNDLAIASINLLDNHSINKIAIIDLDVHQGNGTAKIFENNERVFTFSMHGESNYPHRKEKSDLDIALPYGAQDDLFLAQLKESLNYIFSKVKPDFVFYQSGVDVMENDRLGNMALTKGGVKERDFLVIESCYQNGIPLAITMGGGYSERLSNLIDAHCNTFRQAINMYS